MNEAIKMQVSAFVDGELPQNEEELLLRRLCQDAELRRQAAEYMAMGRIMRGERVVTGVSRLRARIAAELDNRGVRQDMSDPAPAAPRLVRPIVGGAIAATVALAALVGLQQFSSVDTAEQTVTPVAAGADVNSYTVPPAVDDPLRDYFMIHNATASYIGANSINARLVDYQVREELVQSAETAAEEDLENDPETEATAP